MADLTDRRFGRLVAALACTPLPAEPTTQPTGSDLAALLRDPAFRTYLTSVGWRSGQHIVVAAPGETVGALLARIAADTPTPCLLAVPDPQAPHGFQLATVTLPGEPDDLPQPTKGDPL